MFWETPKRDSGVFGLFGGGLVAPYRPQHLGRIYFLSPFSAPRPFHSSFGGFGSRCSLTSRFGKKTLKGNFVYLHSKWNFFFAEKQIIYLFLKWLFLFILLNHLKGKNNFHFFLFPPTLKRCYKWEQKPFLLFSGSKRKRNLEFID